VSLTVMQGWVRIWENGDRSGWHIDSGLVNGKMFTSTSTDQLGHTVYVEAHSASALMGDVILLIGAGQVGMPAPPNATTRGATNVAISASVAPNSNVMVGQRMSFSVSGPPQAVANCGWTNSGTAVGGYTTTVQNGTVIPLDRTNTTFQLYWIDGTFAGQDLNVTGRIQGVIPQARTFSYKVFRPRVDSLSATKTTANPEYFRYTGNLAYFWGFGNPADVPGIRFSGTTTMPAVGGGDIAFIQTANTYRHRTIDDPPLDGVHLSSGGNWVLDRRPGSTEPFYGEIGTRIPSGQTGSVNSDDSPGREETAGDLSFQDKTGFMDYLMFRPLGGGIWVTLAVNSWSIDWGINKNQGTWSLSNSTVPAVVSPTGMDWPVLPQWQDSTGAIVTRGWQPD
jgi:hypothetical protein